MRLPIKERGRERIKTLWEEVISEINLNVTVKQISARWKNIRDSYMRARGNINRKIASGSSAEEKIKADKIKEKHRNYNLLSFLDDTLNKRETSGNVDAYVDLASPASISSNDERKRTSKTDTSDELFFRKMDRLCSSNTDATTPSQHFCLRLASSLEKLPTRMRNKVEIKLLQVVMEAEEELE